MRLDTAFIIKPFLFTALVLLTWQGTAAQAWSDTLSALAVMDRAIMARGGREVLQSVHTISTVTKTTTDGIGIQWIVKEMLPNKGSFQIAQNNRFIYQSWYDGAAGFQILKGVKKKQFPEENKDRPYKKNIFNELDYINPSLWKLEIIGEENVLNDLCYKIRATLINGSVRLLYYNKKSYLLIKEERLLPPRDYVFSNFIYLTYQKKGELVYPHKFKYGEAGKLRDAEITEVLLNSGVEEKDFK
jgi:hypothetical protein